MQETRAFQAEVAKLLDIVVHSLYSNKEIFLRELVSNASDACDKLRYAALTEPALTAGGPEFRITVTPDKSARTLTIADTGIGMSRDELVDNLGTIARSGTGAFLSQLSGDAKKDVNLIGQFGVGFYSGFMVADKVVVTSLKAGETTAHRWTSDGRGEFVVEEAEAPHRGTTITLHLKEAEDEFLDPWRLRGIIKKYSDHIALPVVLVEDGKEETVNAASALWTRSKSEISDEQYKEFYHHVAHAFDAPWMTLHYKAEGAIEYTGLLFVPEAKPLDLFHPDRKQHVKLYVRRVFITDDCAELLPPYLRFVRGVVDSADLPLNVSREMLQHNPVLAKIRTGLIKRILSELKKKSEDAAAYQTFWTNFGPVLKEGLYEDFERKGEILELCRFHTSTTEQPSSLADIKARMKPGQDTIYYITGSDADSLKRSPQLEGFVARGVEVLLLTDPIDEFWVPAVGEYDGVKFKSVGAAGADLSKIEKPADAPEPKEDAAPDDALAKLVEELKKVLAGQVKDVRTSDRLTESAVCLVAEDGDMSLHLERLLRAHQQNTGQHLRILEINPRHPLVKALAERTTGIEDAALLLLDQARIVEGEPLPDPVGFARRMNAVMTRGL